MQLFCVKIPDQIKLIKSFQKRTGGGILSKSFCSFAENDQ